MNDLVSHTFHNQKKKVMNDLVSHAFLQIAEESGRLVKLDYRETLASRDVESAV